MFTVYKIIKNRKTVYVGYSKDISTRTKQHNYLCWSKTPSNKAYNKPFYKFWREVHKTKENGYITLKPLKYFKSKVEAKRWEMFLILKDHFENKQLYNKVPNISR